MINRLQGAAHLRDDLRQRSHGGENCGLGRQAGGGPDEETCVRGTHSLPEAVRHRLATGRGGAVGRGEPAGCLRGRAKDISEKYVPGRIRRQMLHLWTARCVHCIAFS